MPPIHNSSTGPQTRRHQRSSARRGAPRITPRPDGKCKTATTLRPATIVWSAAIGSAFNSAVNATHTVTYNVTGTIGKADISYYTWDSTDNERQVSADNTPIPWSKTVKVKGDLSTFSLSANTHFALNSQTGTLACTLTVDGKIVSRDSAKGDANLVTCDGSGFDGK